MALVGAMHVAAAAGLLLVPQVRERLVPEPLLVVEIREPPREPPPERARPLPQPVMREPVNVVLPPPVIALAPEVAVTPPVPRPTISGPVATPPPAPAPSTTPALEPPRFDMAYLRNPAPRYPTVSRRLREQGRVVLHVLVGPAGEAQSVKVRTSSGFERLDQAALDAVRRWRFAPAHRGAEAVAAWALVPILFQLVEA